MTSGGNNFNYFPESQLPKFKLYPPTSLFPPAPENFCDAFCVAEVAVGRPWYTALTADVSQFGVGTRRCVLGLSFNLNKLILAVQLIVAIIGLTRLVDCSNARACHHSCSTVWSYSQVSKVAY